MHDYKKPNYYAIIPAKVRYDTDLTPNEKLMYREITALCNKEGYCWTNNYYFATLYNVSRRSITRWIDKLKKKNYIEVGHDYVGNTLQINKRKIKLKIYDLLSKG